MGGGRLCEIPAQTVRLSRLHRLISLVQGHETVPASVKQSISACLRRGPAGRLADARRCHAVGARWHCRRSCR
jgi:hypothetical protein